MAVAGTGPPHTQQRRGGQSHQDWGRADGGATPGRSEEPHMLLRSLKVSETVSPTAAPSGPCLSPIVRFYFLSWDLLQG